MLSVDHGYRRATVVGAGLMGRRIAGVLAGGGLEVMLHDANADLLGEATRQAVEVAGTAGAAVRPAPDLAAAVQHADLVVEAVVEDLAIKQALFADLAKLAPRATLATNTSVLPITAVAATTDAPERVVGTHWWNPPDLIPIVEVVAGERTAPEHVERVTSLLTSLGKTPVRVERDGAGFIGNRLQHALWREAIALVAEGVADAATVDLVVRNTIGLRLARMGPIENADFVGLDLTLAIHDAVLPNLDRGRTANPLLRRLVDEGHLGAKTGTGFLDWPAGRRDDVACELAAHVSRQLAVDHPDRATNRTTSSDRKEAS